MRVLFLSFRLANRDRVVQSKGQVADNDLEIIARVRTGDTESFRLLVERYSRSVFRLAFRMTRNEADAEDVVQETFLRAYRQLHSYETRSNFSTWLYRIAANYTLDLLRSKRRTVEQQPLQLEDGTDTFEMTRTGDPGQDRLLISAEIRKRFTLAFDQLSAQERAAFEMRHFDGMSIEDIGSALNLRVSATKNSIFRAVKKLRGALEPLAAAGMGSRQ